MLGFYLFCIYFVALCLLVGPSRRTKQEKWWVEIVTDFPRCTYYFGPFDSDKEASTNTPGYIEDLENEGARNISIRIKQCQPAELTLCDSEVLDGVTA
ncbi:DUF1816 domain-containing protein [Microcoleus sp. N3A4]|uniref:DUF1816 domain-containing protein n=1 Tax=Microcoleus sp. N3A4 TaxID=3055379 RepID=UPI002FD6BF31